MSEEIRKGLTADKLEELRETHGRVYTLKFGEDDDDERVTLAFRWAKPAEMRRFQSTIEKEKNGRRQAILDLFHDVVVYPERAALDAIVETYALAPAAVVNETVELQSGGAPERAKKVVIAKSKD